MGPKRHAFGHQRYPHGRLATDNRRGTFVSHPPVVVQCRSTHSNARKPPSDVRPQSERELEARIVALGLPGPYHPPPLYGAPGDLLIDTGANTFFNHGALLAHAGGQLELASTVRNTATIEATDGGKIDFTGILQQTPSGHLFVSSGGEIDVLGTATGGDAVISGSNSLLHFGAKSTVDTTFAAGAAGTLQLDQSNYTGKISGFALGDSIDLTNITFTAGTTKFHYTPNSTDPTSGGLLRVTDGTHVAKLELQGQYTAANFVLLSDGGGTQIIDPPGNEHPILPILHEIALTGLNEVGFVEGRNVVIEYRWAEGHFDRMPAMAADLVSQKVSIILVGGNLDGVRAVMAATQTIPIIFTTASDPVAARFVASLNHPGGNVTGVTVFAAELGPKRLELLHDLLPTAREIALLVNPRVSTLQDDIQKAETAARRLGLNIIVLQAASEDEIEKAFAIAAQQAHAIQLGTDAFFDSRREQIAALGLRYALPTMALTRRAVAAGSLLSYGANQADVYRQAGIYVGRILKGEKPADLPVLQPSKFELVINMKTAKALGITVPPSLLVEVDEIIE